jgi:8-oxo-dGTP diphosphatase
MYCTECGTALQTAPPTQCVSCGVRLWRNAKPCGALLVVEEGKLLLVRRAVEPWRGRWDVPGGFCEYGEHPMAAAVRETQEETGLSVRATGYLGMWHTEEYAHTVPASITLCAFYHGEIAGPARSNPDGEVSEIHWFTQDDLPDEIAFPEQQVPALNAWRSAVATGATGSPLLDMPDI